MASLLGLGAVDPKEQPWNTKAYQECVGAKIQDCGTKFQGDELTACIDASQAACIASSAAETRTKWLLIGLGFGVVAAAVILRKKAR